MVKINKKLCVGCGNCVEACPFEVLKIEDRKAVAANPEKCQKCGACMSVCPNNAIEIGE